MSLHCDLQIHINGQHTFFLKEKIISAYSGKLRKITKEEKRRTQIKNSGIEVNGFPGSSDGFELVSRFCYNKGQIQITVSNVSLLYCCAIFLGMSEKVSANNLLHQTDKFLEGIFYWSWGDVIVSLKSCESFLTYADSVGLVPKLIRALLVKVAQNSDVNSLITSSSSSSSSPEAASGFKLSSSPKMTPESMKQFSSSKKAWWFDDLTVLSPSIIEKVVKSLGAYGNENNSLVLTRFLLHYLKTVSQQKGSTGVCNLSNAKTDYVGLADTAVYGVILAGKSAFSCRGLLRVLRIVSGFGLSKDCRVGLERLIGGMLDQATLDDLLVSGHDRGVYDVNLVVRLIRMFANGDAWTLQKIKKVARLVDKYLGEIAPDQTLKISKFLGVAESLPDSARDSFDGVYRAIDIFLESHPSLSFEERSRLCRCLNYEKLSFETCKELAKNPKVPPRVAVQALMSQHSLMATKVSLDGDIPKEIYSPIATPSDRQVVVYNGVDADSIAEENEGMRVNLQRMQWRVNELEKVCKEMKGQMSRIVRHPTSGARALPRLC